MPIELQKDVARLRQYYAQQGFLHAGIAYDISGDTEKNEVDIVFEIIEGPPLALGKFEVIALDGRQIDILLPESLRSSWRSSLQDIESDLRQPVDDLSILNSEVIVRKWFQDNGYAFAQTEMQKTVDEERNRVDVSIHTDPGPRSYIGEIQIEGLQTVSERAVRRKLVFGEGSLFNGESLMQARNRVFGLQLFRMVLVDLPPQPRDSSVAVSVRVTEGRPRRISAGFGYSLEHGLQSEATWSHLNTFGAAQRLDINAIATTGLFSTTSVRELTYQGSVSLTQPLGRLDVRLTPAVEYRDDRIDKSLTYGSEAAVSAIFGKSDAVDFTLGYSRKRLFSLRRLDTSLLELLAIFSQGQLDTLKATNRSHLTLSTSLNRVDNLLEPQKGFVLKNTVEVSGPPVVSDVQYVRLTSSLRVYRPINRRLDFHGRINLGRLIPFGSSVPRDDGFIVSKILSLQDFLFYGGGTHDTRGWFERDLGPKFTDFDLTEDNINQEIVGADTVITVRNSFYSPLGGFAKLSASVELQFPARSNKKTHFLVFLDAGRVWNPDKRFRSGTPTLENVFTRGSHRLFFGTGAGLAFDTLVGPIRLSIGYKLNPSLLDVRDSTEIINNLFAGGDIESVRARFIKRFSIHFSLGAGI